MDWLPAIFDMTCKGCSRTCIKALELSPDGSRKGETSRESSHRILSPAVLVCGHFELVDRTHLANFEDVKGIVV